VDESALAPHKEMTGSGLLRGMLHAITTLKPEKRRSEWNKHPSFDL
jgi:hypothetical protein